MINTAVIVFFLICFLLVLAAAVVIITVQSELEYVDRDEDPIQAEWDAAEIVLASRPAPLSFREEQR